MIEKDTDRTHFYEYKRSINIKEHQNKLYKILNKIFSDNESYNYTQGMNDIASVFYIVAIDDSNLAKKLITCFFTNNPHMKIFLDKKGDIFAKKDIDLAHKLLQLTYPSLYDKEYSDHNIKIYKNTLLLQSMF